MTRSAAVDRAPPTPTPTAVRRGALDIVWRPTAGLVPFAKNARTHSTSQVDQIVNSIRTFGFTNPVLLDQDMGIIAGHGRVLAAQKAGMPEVPTITLSYLTDAQKRAYIIADNKLALNAGWDEELLIEEIKAIRDMDELDLSLLGFSEDELSVMLEEEKTGACDEDEVPDLQPTVISKLGDIWLLGDHRIICGDSTDAATVDRLLVGVKPHLMVTDPPYGVSYDPTWRDDCGGQFGDGKTKMRGKVENDDRADWSEAWALFPGDVAYVWHGALHAGVVAESLAKSNFAIRSQIIWSKSHFILSRGDYHWHHEPCWYAVKKGKTGHYCGDRSQTTIWEIAGLNPAGRTRDVADVKSVHGTQKPVECMRRPILNNSSPGQAVYDPFAGSGSTLIACELTGRSCYTIELNPAYVDLVVRRWQTITEKEGILEGDGRSFADVTLERGEV